MADTKLSALTELAATPADDDEVYIRDVSEAANAESKRITIANLIAGAGGATTTSGSYTGDNSVNRAIPHGLGVTPKVVFLVFNAGFRQFIIQLAFITHLTDGGIVTTDDVTTPDATNFYVGDAADYEGSANAVHLYNWIAIG